MPIFRKKIQASIMKFGVVFLTLIFGSEKGLASPQIYGGIFWHPDASETLFVIDKIKKGDSFELRKALRRHQIKNVVLASPGGSVYEALNMSGIIRDNRLRTIVLDNSRCASACSFLYFSGVERQLKGDLGVHQFSSGGSGVSEDAVQYTVSEIIGFLNEFEVPPFVFERMFEDTSMYWFSHAEKKLLETQIFSASQNEKANYEQLYERISKEVLYQPVEASGLEKNKALQRKLAGLGCYNGPVDGLIGPASRAALQRYIVSSGLKVDLPKTLDVALVDKLLKAPDIACSANQYAKPKTIPNPQPKTHKNIFFKTRYRASCLRGTTISSSMPVLVSYDRENLSGVVKVNMAGEADRFNGIIHFRIQGNSITTDGADILSLKLAPNRIVTSFHVKTFGRCNLFLIK